MRVHRQEADLFLELDPHAPEGLINQSAKLGSMMLAPDYSAEWGLVGDDSPGGEDEV